MKKRTRKGRSIKVELNQSDLFKSQTKKQKIPTYILITIIALLIILGGFLGYYTGSIIYQGPESENEAQEFIKVAEKTTAGVVTILTDSGSGSGIVYGKDGLIVTNYHVIDNIKNIRVLLSDKRIFNGTVLGYDVESDIAVIKINAEDLPTAKLADSDNLEVGEKVIAIGNPFGFDHTVTTGIVSATHRSKGPTIYRDFIQTDANINPGNSGGPLINLKGEVIGLNTFVISGANTPGLGFAIPINLVKKVVDKLLKYGEVKRGFLGVSVKDLIQVNEKGDGKILDGAVIIELQKEGPADKAGAEVGDVIKKLDGILIENGNHLKNILADLEPDSEVELEIDRPKKEGDYDKFVFKITLGARPELSKD
ncbi:trypsin-like peptidase domain-containing protein [Candidatus Woesearchaeota archaeon]|nr:trypsin-like peptidase domain-containing protein [Candidatus Woesearchaeota archaeon]